MSQGRVTRRVATVVLAYLVLLAVATVADFDPDPLLLALVVALSVAGLWLLFDALVDDTSPWAIEPISQSGLAGRDGRLDNYQRAIENHLAAREPTDLVQERLRGLAASVLDQRYSLELEDPRAIHLLGPEVVGLLYRADHRIALAEIDRCVSRIEEL